MNLTKENSLGEIVAAIANLPYPQRPSKPSALNLKTAEDHRKYAERLEVFEHEEAEYTALRAEYNAEKGKLEALFVEKLFSESYLTRPVFDIVYAKAYSDGHSGGYMEVSNTFDELEAFAMSIIQKAK